MRNVENESTVDFIGRTIREQAEVIGMYSVLVERLIFQLRDSGLQPSDDSLYLKERIRTMRGL